MAEPSAEQIAEEALAHGQITEADRDAVVEFAQFLADLAKRPPNTPLPLPVLRRHRSLLNLSDEDLREIEKSRGVEAGG